MRLEPMGLARRGCLMSNKVFSIDKPVVRRRRRALSGDAMASGLREAAP